MTIEEIVTLIKTRIEKEVKKDFPNWQSIETRASNAKILMEDENRKNQINQSYTLDGQIVESKKFEF